MPLTRGQGMNTRRPNANPEPLEGTYSGTRGQPSNVGGSPKAIYDTERRDSVRYIPTPVAVQEDFVPQGKVGVYDRFGNRRGTMGMHGGGAATAARFLGDRHFGAELKRTNGKYRLQERGRN
jgi:hypothetical protein